MTLWLTSYKFSLQTWTHSHILFIQACLCATYICSYINDVKYVLRMFSLLFFSLQGCGYVHTLDTIILKLLRKVKNIS